MLAVTLLLPLIFALPYAEGRYAYHGFPLRPVYLNVYSFSRYQELLRKSGNNHLGVRNLLQLCSIKTRISHGALRALERLSVPMLHSALQAGSDDDAYVREAHFTTSGWMLTDPFAEEWRIHHVLQCWTRKSGFYLRSIMEDYRKRYRLLSR